MAKRDDVAYRRPPWLDAAIKGCRSGRSMASVARSLGVPPRDLYSWLVAEGQGDLVGLKRPVWVAKAVELYGSGKSGPEVGRELGVPLTSIYSWLRREGVEIRSPGGNDSGSPAWLEEAIERCKAGESVTSVASSLGVSPRKMYRLLCREGVEVFPGRGEDAGYVPEWLEGAIASYRGGESGTSIARRVGTNQQTVYKWLHKYGVELRARSGRPVGYRPEWLDSAVERYRAGESGVVLAQSSGVDPQTLYRWLRIEGVEIRSPGQRRRDTAPAWLDIATERYRSGDSGVQIAWSLGINTSSVYRWLRREGIEVRPCSGVPDSYRPEWLDRAIERYRSGESGPSIARSLQVPRSTLYARLRSEGMELRPRSSRSNSYRPEWLDRAIERYRSGESGPSIARSLGITTATLYAWLRREGVEIRPRNGRSNSYRPEWLDRAIERYRSGESGPSIARSLGISEVTVYKWLHREGAEIRPRSGRSASYRPEWLDRAIERYRSGESGREIAVSFGVSHAYLYTQLRLAGVDLRLRGGLVRGYRPEWLSAAAKRYTSGESGVQIARSLGIDTRTVYKWLRREGVEVRA